MICKITVQACARRKRQKDLWRTARQTRRRWQCLPYAYPKPGSAAMQRKAGAQIDAPAASSRPQNAAPVMPHYIRRAAFRRTRHAQMEEEILIAHRFFRRRHDAVRGTCPPHDAAARPCTSPARPIATTRPPR